MICYELRLIILPLPLQRSLSHPYEDLDTKSRSRTHELCGDPLMIHRNQLQRWLDRVHRRHAVICEATMCEIRQSAVQSAFENIAGPPPYIDTLKIVKYRARITEWSVCFIRQRPEGALEGNSFPHTTWTVPVILLVIWMMDRLGITKSQAHAPSIYRNQ